MVKPLGGEGLNPGRGGPAIGQGDEKAIVLVRVDCGGGLTPEPSGLAAIGSDDIKGLIAGGGPVANGIETGRPGTLGRPGLPVAI